MRVDDWKERVGRLKEKGCWRLLYRFLPMVIVLLAAVRTMCDVWQLTSEGAWWPGWPTYNYYIGYETGFGGRKLLGTLVDWLAPEYVEYNFVRLLTRVANVLMVLFATLIGVKAVARRENAWPMLLMLAAYMLSPFSLGRYVDSTLSGGFMETWQIMLTLMWLLIYVRWRGKAGCYVVTGVVMVLCCLIHHTFCCTLLPLYGVLFLLDTFRDGRLCKPKAVAYGSILGVLGVLFLVLWMCSRMNVDIDTLYARIENRVEPSANPSDKWGLYLLYYATNSENVASNAGLFPQRYVELLFSVVMLRPLVALFWAPWLRAARAATDKNVKRLYRSVCPLHALMTLPIFIFATDYSRWWVCYFLTLTLLLVAAHLMGVKDVVEQTRNLFRKPIWVVFVVLVVVYLQFLHNEQWHGLREAIGLREGLGILPTID